MIIGPKYKIARRLGAGVFEKTQTQKFALREARKTRSDRRPPKTDFGLQLLEKQKARYAYALTERQFSKYVKSALAKKGNNSELLYRLLETRLDNAVVKAGFATTRLAARQMVSHGHIMVNDKKVSIPSYQVKTGDTLSVRAGSAAKPLFADYKERMEKYQSPSWINVIADKKSAVIQGEPKLNVGEQIFDIGQVLEFYSR